jgi:hypothetical protein
MVNVVDARNSPAVAVNVAAVSASPVPGGVYVVAVPVGCEIVPGPSRDQEISSVLLVRALTETPVDPKYVVLATGVTARVGDCAASPPQLDRKPTTRVAITTRLAFAMTASFARHPAPKPLSGHDASHAP